MAPRAHGSVAHMRHDTSSGVTRACRGGWGLGVHEGGKKKSPSCRGYQDRGGQCHSCPGQSARWCSWSWRPGVRVCESNEIQGQKVCAGAPANTSHRVLCRTGTMRPACLSHSRTGTLAVPPQGIHPRERERTCTRPQRLSQRKKNGYRRPKLARTRGGTTRSGLRRCRLALQTVGGGRAYPTRA